MSGREILVDTNILIYLLQGDDKLLSLLQGAQVYVSFITELELYGLRNASKEYEQQIEAALDECLIISMNAAILRQYRSIRKNSKLKLADSIIAATALAYEIPLITADEEFSAVKLLQLIQYES